MQQAELQSSLIQRINEAHYACISAVDDMSAAVLRSCNLARECGVFLLELRESSPHGTWESLFAGPGKSETSFRFTSRTANNYINFAKANPDLIVELADGIRSMKGAMVAAGALPSRSHGPQESHTGEDNFFITAGKQLMAFSALWEKQMTLHPVDAWNKETAEQFVVQMEPIVEKLNNVYKTAKARAYKKAA